MKNEEIVSHLISILMEYTPSDDPYRGREMRDRGASEDAIAVDEARAEGREEVCESIRRLLDQIKEK